MRINQMQGAPEESVHKCTPTTKQRSQLVYYH